MSRCFPYPPPGYVRKPPVAVAEAETTAKLQKEREKAEKKKEKRSDKKALRPGETSKHSKHSHKKRKHDDASTAGQEPKKVSKESVEQLEKSGLSEEHGVPCFSQTVRDSPESSQDSSKRRKVVLPNPSQAKNGNVVRIKIKSNQDSQAAVLEKPRVLEQPPVQQMGSGSLLSKQNSMQHHNRVNARSAGAQQRISSVSQEVQNRVIAEPPAKTMQRVMPNPAVKVTQPVDPQLSVKAPVGRSDLPPKLLGSMEPSPARAMGRSGPHPVKTTQRVQHPPAKILQKDIQMPSEDILRKSPAVGTKVEQNEFRSPAVRPLEAPQPPLPKRTEELSALKQQQEPSVSVPKEEACFSGRNAEAAQAAPVKEVKLSRSDRKKIRKAEKKEKKYSDLFVTWNPSSIDMQGSDLGEQDYWLLGGTKDASMTCRASDCSVPCQSMVQQPLLQPRATFLPDLQIYQLPYVIPF